MFDETNFPRELVIGVLIPKFIGFTIIKIIGFDPIVAEVGNVAIHTKDSRFYTHVVVWLKTRTQSNGWQWSFIQITNTRFYFVSPWSFEST
jgi:hypothetical protein